MLTVFLEHSATKQLNCGLNISLPLKQASYSALNPPTKNRGYCRLHQSAYIYVRNIVVNPNATPCRLDTANDNGRCFESLNRQCYLKANYS